MVERSKSKVRIAPNIETFIKKAPITEDFTNMKTAGSERIRIELEDEPEKMVGYIKKYNQLVARSASLIKMANPDLSEKKFIFDMWAIMYYILKIKYGSNKFGTMYESLATGKFDCDTSAFLVLDVGKLLGIDVEMIIVPKHVLIKTKNFFFETVTKSYAPITQLNKYYPIIYNITSNIDEIQFITYTEKGKSYALIGKYDKGILCFTKAIEINPNYPDAYISRGVTYCKMGKFDEAMSDFNKVIEIDPNNVDVYLTRGLANYGRGKFDEAMSDFNKVIEIDPNNAVAYIGKGAVYHQMGKFDEAMLNFSRAMKIKQSNNSTHTIKEYWKYLVNKLKFFLLKIFSSKTEEEA